MQKERITFQTEDGVTIVGDWLRAGDEAKWAALLLHMMPADRTSWAGFDDALAHHNISSLAIDLRGHGESVQRGSERLDFRVFSNEDHQGSQLDLVAAESWLIGQGIALDHIVVVGASIGANLALAHLATHPQLPGAVLLSPGLDYRGIRTDRALLSLRPEQSLLFVSSRRDPECARDVVELDRLTSVPHEVFWLEGSAHGTDLFRQDPHLADRIAVWVAQRCR